MTTKTITLQKLKISTTRKDIKNIHLGVYPPDGKIRASIPLKTSDETLRLFLISKTSWIKKQQEKFLQQQRQSKREYVSGESHYLFGNRYRLNVIDTNESPKIKIHKKTHLNLYVKSNTSLQQKEKLFERFYRLELEKIIPKLLKKWGKKVGVDVNQVKIRKMKTKWGTCNAKKKQILLNLEMAKKPLHCLEYVFVHELVHMIERNHTDKFIELVESAYPKWKKSKQELNQGILSYSVWKC
jgi:predicted metal-dependent hydrolase